VKSQTPIPEGYHTVTPSLTVGDAARALDFYTRAFGAEEVMRMAGPGGKIMHAELKIGSSRLMLQDEMPEMRTKSPRTYGGSPVTFYVYVPDVEAAWKQATGAGAKIVMNLEDMFWGDRIGAVEDPYGHQWTLAQHMKDPSEDDMKRGHEELSAKLQHATN
jgi:PhnB protein